MPSTFLISLFMGLSAVASASLTDGPEVPEPPVEELGRPRDLPRPKNPGGSLLPDYSADDVPRLHRDMALLGGIVMGTGTALWVGLPPWNEFHNARTDQLVNAYSGENRRRVYMTAASTMGTVVGAGSAFGLYMATGGHRYNWPRAIVGGAIGTGAGYFTGMAAGIVMRKAFDGRTNVVGEQDFALPFGMQASTWGFLAGLGAATGIVRGGGLEQRSDLVMLPVQMSHDGSQAYIGPALSGRF